MNKDPENHDVEPRIQEREPEQPPQPVNPFWLPLRDIRDTLRWARREKPFYGEN
jgi:hypothetical protein